MLDTFRRMLGLPEDVPSQVTDMWGGFGVGLLDWAGAGCRLGFCLLEADALGLAAFWTDCLEKGLPVSC